MACLFISASSRRFFFSSACIMACLFISASSRRFFFSSASLAFFSASSLRSLSSSSFFCWANFFLLLGSDLLALGLFFLEPLQFFLLFATLFAPFVDVFPQLFVEFTLLFLSLEEQLREYINCSS